MRWLIVLLMASSAMGAEITNRFTFTNAVGEVFRDATLVKIDGDDALVIAGTIGARVKIEELPGSIQAILAERATQRAMRYRGVKTDSDKGKQTDWVPLRGEIEGASAFVTFNRRIDGGSAQFRIDVLVTLRTYAEIGRAFSFRCSRGGVSCTADLFDGAKSKPDAEAENGFVWQAFMQGAVSKEEMLTLSLSSNLDLYLQSGSKSCRIGVFPMGEMEGFANLCSDTKEGSSLQPRAAAGRSFMGTEIEVAGATMRVTEENSTWSRFSFQVKVRNAGAEPTRRSLVVEFLDADGFILAGQTIYNTELPPAKVSLLDGYELIDAKVAGRVRKVRARFK